MMACEMILHRMDELYDEALAHPRNTKIKGELLGLSEALIAAYRLELDDIRWLMGERYEARVAGTQPPTIRRLAEHRLRSVA